MNNAYIIRTDGKLFPVSVYQYDNPDDIEDTLIMTEWLYKSTASADTKRAIIDL